MPFSSQAKFFPKWNADARVTGLCHAGGIPAYLNWLNPDEDMIENIRQEILNPGRIFLAELAFLMYDEVREPKRRADVPKVVGIT